MRSILDMNAFHKEDLGGITDPEIKKETERRLRLFGAPAVLFFKQPVEVVKGEGCYLIDKNGERYLDCYNNVACIGHGHPRVADYVNRQLLAVNTHTRYLNKVVDDYAEKLLSTFPAPLTNVALTCTGTESNDLAMRMAMYFTGGRGFIVTDGAYHGNSYLVTMASPSATHGKTNTDFVRTVPAPDTFRVAGDELGAMFAADIEKAIASFEEDGIKFAGLIVDDIFSSDGVFADPAGFLKAAVDVVHRHGGLYIADEVQPGFGRTGVMWGFMRHGVMPDIVTMGKPMGNGFPMSAAVTRPEITDVLAKSTGYFNTFGGSPAAAAAGTAVLEVLEEDGLVAKAASTGDYFRAELRKLMDAHPCIGDVRGAGLFTGLELVKDLTSKEPDGEAATLVINRLAKHHVLTGCAGKAGNTLKIRPPLRFGKADADVFIEAFKASLEELHL